MLQISKKLLPRSTTSYSFWLSLSSSSYINFPNVISGCHCSELHFPCQFVFPVWKSGAKTPENAAKLHVDNARKFQKFSVSSIYRFGDIIVIWMENVFSSHYGDTKIDWSAWRDKSGHVFLNNKEIPGHLTQEFVMRA